MKEEKKFLVVVAGPTAVGKTAFSIQLAQYFGTEIISADSRQLYQKMTIGTAKPTEEERAAVPHHFIDILPPEKDYNAGHFERDALALLDELFKKHQAVVVAGGSGMYVQALCNGIDQMPEVPTVLRNQLNEKLEKEGLAGLVAELKALDPLYYEEVDRQNPQRVVRALEICLHTGQPFSSFRQQKTAKRPFKIIKIGLERPREELYQRIGARMDAMIAEGLFEEAASLYPKKSLNALQTVGYREIFDYMDGFYDREEAVRLLKRNSRRYAKRQLTWFRKDPEFLWLHPGELPKAIDYIERKIKEAL
ncbi:tRNA (adenosine(37)-N6)-dimethylallyltransferase MiaA [Nafulsella turpanensis]|uniref:tRNA (adenosine(37)-N6)-dimethylallyltransferase MiaA n=1 Tax=Nafulsella turpanensis TaxID=1265690 RepID=UPI00058CF8E9|nr:tRNA (adenosine(37)-N6)-dimethylallyltransferase MiaA [Nafulsella turpanensis]